MDFLRSLGNLLGLTNNNQDEEEEEESGGWSLSNLIRTYGPLVQVFLGGLALVIAESQRQNEEENRRQARRQQQRSEPQPQQQFYMFSGIPRITGNPYLDQMIIASNGELFQHNMQYDGDGGIRFQFQLGENQQRLPTMEELLTATFNQANQNSGTATAPGAVSRLPKIRLTQERMDFKQKLQETLQTDACGICIEDYKLDEELIQLPCGHAFHSDCIMPWIESHNTCPTCRYELPITDANQESERVARMKERFTLQGLEIMQISAEDDTIFDKIYDIKKEIEKKGDKRQILSNLSSCESFLDGRIDKLDRITGQNDHVKHMKKNEILKIQFLQERLDALRRQIE